MKAKKPGDSADQIVAFYAAGNSAKATARRFGCMYLTVRSILSKRGVWRPHPTNTVPQEVEQKVRRLWESGENQTAIARVVGFSQIKVGRILVRQGFRLHRRNAGPRHGAWKGGRYVANGYVRVWVPPDDPLRQAMADNSGYILEHRLVVARSLGRALNTWETVHHINGNRTDNQLENLQLRQGNHGKGVVLCCAACGSRNIIESPLTAD